LEKGLYGMPLMPIVRREDQVLQTRDTIVVALMKQLPGFDEKII